MLVHQSNRRCNCCGNLIPDSIEDLPIEEVKLSAFPVACECGYFYEAYHYPVSFIKWRTHKSRIEYDINYCNSELNLLKQMDKEIGLSNRQLENRTRFAEALKSHQAKLDALLSVTPIPDHLWDENKLG